MPATTIPTPRILTVITGKNLPPSSHSPLSPPLPNQLLVDTTSPAASPSTLVNTQVHPNHTTALTPTTTPLVNKKESDTAAKTITAVADDDGDSDSGSGSEEDDLTYRLMTEIQDVLIEDFYPPMSSSTVPGNPGRLYVILP